MDYRCSDCKFGDCSRLGFIVRTDRQTDTHTHTHTHTQMLMIAAVGVNNSSPYYGEKCR